MEEYLETYGWHFSKNMYTWAMQVLKKSVIDTKPIEFLPKEKIDELLKKVHIKNISAYDVYYLVHYCKAIHGKSAIEDEVHLLKYLKDILDGNYEEQVFTHFYADCIARGIPIIWEDML